MTQEDKELLLKDLCARLPYRVKVQQSPKYADKHFADKWEKEPHDFNIIGISGKNTLVTDKNTTERTYAKGIVPKPVTVCIYDGLTKQTVRPYLRPLSSMTEEEAKEIAILHGIKDILSVKVTSVYIDVIVDDGVCSTERRTIWYDEIVSSVKCFDFLTAHHFDYRGLIEKGLALEAPEGMYKLNKK